MAYLRPNAFERRIFSNIAMKFGIGGSETFVVTGRKSGEPKLVPVTPLDHGGQRYVISTRGESEWVRNLRAAGGACELRKGAKAEKLHASEVPVEECPPILAAYRLKAGRPVKAYFEKLPDAADHPVFRLGSR
ncbi:MAG: nitroreductase/quinone reductase family protein [Tepidiformaceae bacterium]